MNTLISINRIYYLIGIIVMLLVGMTLRDRGNPKRRKVRETLEDRAYRVARAIGDLHRTIGIAS